MKFLPSTPPLRYEVIPIGYEILPQYLPVRYDIIPLGYDFRR